MNWRHLETVSFNKLMPRIHGTTVIRDIFRQTVLELNLFSNNVISNIYLFFLLLIRKEISYLTEAAVHMVDNMKKKTRNCEDPLDWYFCVSIHVEITAVGYQRNLSLLFPVVTVNKYFCALTIRRWSYL